MTPEERAKRVAWFEAAHALHELTGEPLERCLLAVQQQEIQLTQFQQGLNHLMEWFTKVFLPAFVEDMHSFLERIAPALQAFQDLLDQQEAQRRNPLCPHHGEPLRGGRCKVCDRRNQPRRI